MRANGVAERYCTGAAKPYEKFQAWAATVPHTLRNPLYHWTHLELKRYFGIDELLDEQSAARIWKKAGEQLATPELSAQGILKKFKVVALCTTDDPCDSLEYHRALAASGLADESAAGIPARQGAGGEPAGPVQCVDQTPGGSGRHGYPGPGAPARSLKARHEYFHAQGCRLSDHGLSQCYSDFCSLKTAAGHLRQGAAGQGGLTGRAGAVRRVHDVVLRAARRGQGLDQAASPGRAAQQQHAPAQRAWTGHGLRLHRRLSARHGAGGVPGRAGAASTRCPRRSSTTSTRRTITSSPR